MQLLRGARRALASRPVLALGAVLVVALLLRWLVVKRREGVAMPLRRVTLTEYESFPAANSAECTQWSGCKYKGKFALYGDAQLPAWWVKERNIAAVHVADGAAYLGKWVRILYKGRLTDVRIIDVCSDGDTPNGECTTNKNWPPNKPTGFLIDLEYHTARRMGFTEGRGEAKFVVVPTPVFLNGSKADFTLPAKR